jgi:hypothetical protein
MIISRLALLQGRLDTSEQLVKRLDVDLACSRQATASALAGEESERAQRLEVTSEKTAVEQRLQSVGQQLNESLKQAEACRQRYLIQTQRCFMIAVDIKVFSGPRRRQFILRLVLISRVLNTE